MKKLLLFLGLFSTIAIPENLVEKNGISIEYGICWNSSFAIRHRLSRSIQIKNLSSKTIIVDPSVISVPLVSLQEAVKARRGHLKDGSILFGLCTTVASCMACFSFKDMRNPHVVYNPQPGDDIRGKTIIFTADPRMLLASNMVLLAGFSLLSVTTLYKMMISESQEALEAKFSNEVLNAPFQIQPGGTVKKIFWLKNSRDQASINFDAIKIIG